MTTAAAPLLPAPRPSRYDRWRARAAADPVLRRRVAWIAPLLITLLAGVLRMWNLGHPQQIVFDETYYVKDAWSQWNLGYPSEWPDGADERFAAGETDIFGTEPSFVVHPPLGKYLIGAGMALFGADSAFGWRIAVAVAGTATVLVLYALAFTLSRSIAFASIAGLLLAVDGIAIVLSRVAILDALLTFFVVLAVWFAALDRRRHVDRLAWRAVRRAREGPLWWGPILWARPWLVAAGVAAGAATAVKWSGLWVLAALGLYTVVTDALARRRLGVYFWPTDAVRQGAVSFLLLVPPAAAVYLASWTGWLVTDGGYGRHAVDGEPASGLLTLVPAPLRNLWHLHETIYASTASISSPHPYASAAWQWPLLLRPTSMYAFSTADGVDGCASARGCIEVLYSMPNPLLWWGGIAAILWMLYRFVRAPDARTGLVLTALASTYLPWLLYPERTIFQFYTVVMLPFLVLAVCFALRDIAGPPQGDPTRRLSGVRVVTVILTVVLAVSALWYPLWSAVSVPYEFYWLHAWLPGWI